MVFNNTTRCRWLVGTHTRPIRCVSKTNCDLMARASFPALSASCMHFSCVMIGSFDCRHMSSLAKVMPLHPSRLHNAVFSNSFDAEPHIPCRLQSTSIGHLHTFTKLHFKKTLWDLEHWVVNGNPHKAKLLRASLWKL